MCLWKLVTETATATLKISFTKIPALEFQIMYRCITTWLQMSTNVKSDLETSHSVLFSSTENCFVLSMFRRSTKYHFLSFNGQTHHTEQVLQDWCNFVDQHSSARPITLVLRVSSLESQGHLLANRCIGVEETHITSMCTMYQVLWWSHGFESCSRSQNIQISGNRCSPTHKWLARSRSWRPSSFAI